LPSRKITPFWVPKNVQKKKKKREKRGKKEKRIRGLSAFTTRREEGHSPNNTRVTKGSEKREKKRDKNDEERGHDPRRLRGNLKKSHVGGHHLKNKGEESTELGRQQGRHEKEDSQAHHAVERLLRERKLCV